MKKAILVAVVVVVTPILVLVGGLFLVTAASSSASAVTACGTTSASTSTVSAAVPKQVGSWNQAQLTIAAQLVGVAHQMNANTQATTILVMTAMGESSLTDLEHGDAVDNSTIGVLQQGASYGTRAERLDVPTAAKAFLTRLLGVPGWASMQPTLAAHAVQGNADPYVYAPFWTDAQQVVASLTGTDVAATTGCAVSGDQTELATTLAAAWKAGTFTDTYHPQMVEKEILPIATGTSAPGCQVDTRILQLLVAALNKYGSVQISDMNRPCVGISTNCPGSLHCANPARAVDFNAIGGKVLLGSGSTDLDFLAWLDTVMPKGSQAGQAECRTDPVLSNISQFDDTCTHQHVDLGSTTTALTLSTSVA